MPTLFQVPDSVHLNDPKPVDNPSGTGTGNGNGFGEDPSAETEAKSHIGTYLGVAFGFLAVVVIIASLIWIFTGKPQE
jgi:hypothetical protein